VPRVCISEQLPVLVLLVLRPHWQEGHGANMTDALAPILLIPHGLRLTKWPHAIPSEGMPDTNTVMDLDCTF
jgi:hypothetical protein